MSRQSIPLSDYTKVHAGSDHALGSFFDITDSRYAGSPEDEQGEGYLLEWSEVFGFSTNLIGAKIEDLRSSSRLNKLIETFLASKGLL